MPTRFDHTVIAIRDLDTAIDRFRYLGFDAQPGGRHTGRGTHNGLIRFGLDYIELLSVYDETEARANGAGGHTILDALHGRDAALVGFALATTSIEQEAKHFRGTEAVAPQPHAMHRTRPDGQKLTWRTLSPGGASWNRPWPFLIQWDTPDEQRLQIDVPGVHPNGATSWVHIAVATRDLDKTLDVYQNQLGLELLKRDAVPGQAAHRVTYSIGKGTIDLLAPDGEGTLQQILSDNGEGPFELTFAVKNLEQTRAFLEQRQIRFKYETAPDGLVSGKLAIAPDEALGVRLNLVSLNGESHRS
jgi:catechol 2,3-dioxygenase-like lactoylglutathione lyase family enzyme